MTQADDNSAGKGHLLFGTIINRLINSVTKRIIHTSFQHLHAPQNRYLKGNIILLAPGLNDCNDLWPPCLENEPTGLSEQLSRGVTRSDGFGINRSSPDATKSDFTLATNTCACRIN